VAGAEEMVQAEGDADKAGVGAGDLEAHSNKITKVGGEECRMGGTQGGRAIDGRRPPIAHVIQKLPYS
jgi:hypothetical protein